MCFAYDTQHPVKQTMFEIYLKQSKCLEKFKRLLHASE